MTPNEMDHSPAVGITRMSESIAEIPHEPANSRQVGGQHYKTMDIQPWEVMEAVLTREEWIGYLKGNCIKYGMRQGRKVDAEDDAAKARHYAQKLSEVMDGLAGF